MTEYCICFRLTGRSPLWNNIDYITREIGAEPCISRKMLRGKVTVGSAPVLVLWSCSGIWWMCMVWAGGHSSVHPVTPFIFVADATQLGAAGNKSLNDLLGSATRLSDIDKENTVNVTHGIKTDQCRNAARNSKNRNGNIFIPKTKSSPIHAVPYDSVTKNLIHFLTIHDKIRHFLKFMGNYDICRLGLQEREAFFVSHENKLDNISSLEQTSEMNIGNTKESIAVRSKYTYASPTSFTDFTSETSFTNNSLDRVNFYDGHTLSTKRMNCNMTVENTDIFICNEHPRKKSNQISIYDLDGSNCLVNTSKIHIDTHLYVKNSLPTTNSSIHISRCAPNVSYAVKESENVQTVSKSDKARENVQNIQNFTMKVVSEQISTDFKKPPLNYTDYLGRKLEQIGTDKYSKNKTLETLKSETKTWRNEIHHEISYLNQHGDNGTEEDEDSRSRFRILARTTNFKKANRTSDLQQGQDTFRKNTVRELRGLYSPVVMSSWNANGVPNLMNNKNNIKLTDKYWQPMWYNVR